MKIDNQKALEYVNNLNVSKCSLCGHTKWGLSDKIFQLTEFTPDGVGAETSVFPVLVVSCNNCGNTHLINAITAGIVEKQNTVEDKDR